MQSTKFTLFHKPNPAVNHTPLSVRDLGWDSPTNLLNLATLFTPSADQTSLLERGLSFIPCPTKLDREELQSDLHKFHRRLKLTDHFFLQPDRQPVPFTHPSHWEPHSDTLHLLTQQCININKRALQRFRPPTDVPDNLTRPERRALTDLIHNPNIIIKPADKGSKIIIMDRQQYMT